MLIKVDIKSPVIYYKTSDMKHKLDVIKTEQIRSYESAAA